MLPCCCWIHCAVGSNVVLKEVVLTLYSPPNTAAAFQVLKYGFYWLNIIYQYKKIMTPNTAVCLPVSRGAILYGGGGGGWMY